MNTQALTQDVDANAPGYREGASAEAVAKTPSTKTRILEAVDAVGAAGYTREELQVRFNDVPADTLRRRIDELVAAGQLKGDDTYTRTNSRGNKQFVYTRGNGRPVLKLKDSLRLTPTQIADQLGRAFVWGNTTQGEDYWRQVHTNLLNVNAG